MLDKSSVWDIMSLKCLQGIQMEMLRKWLDIDGYSRQALKWSLKTPTSWYSEPGVTPLLQWLASKQWNTAVWEEVTSGISLQKQKDVTSTLVEASLMAFMVPTSWSKAPCCELLFGEAHMAKDWGQLLANSQEGPEALSATTREVWNAARNHVSEPGSGSFPSPALSEDPSTGQHLDCSLTRP